MEAFNTLFRGRKGKFQTAGSVHRRYVKYQALRWKPVFDPAQFYGTTEMSTTPSMTTPSIGVRTVHNPILLSDVTNTPVTVHSTQRPS